jgi:hypothetical protein
LLLDFEDGHVMSFRPENRGVGELEAWMEVEREGLGAE